MEQIKEGLSPFDITRIVKSVKYALYWEFDTKERYEMAKKSLRQLLEIYRKMFNRSTG